MAYLISGLVLGLSAGLAPGPLLTLVISETLGSGVRAGIRVALAPLLTDAPIIAVTLLILSRLADTTATLGIISLTGAAFLVYLGIEGLTYRENRTEGPRTDSAALQKGIMVNFLNPHPYIFWLTIGGPLVLKANRQGVLWPGLFLAAFYLLLVGSKLLLAILVGRSSHLVRGRSYLWIQRALGLALLVFAVLFAREGLTSLGLWPL